MRSHPASEDTRRQTTLDRRHEQRARSSQVAAYSDRIRSGRGAKAVTLRCLRMKGGPSGVAAAAGVAGRAPHHPRAARSGVVSFWSFLLACMWLVDMSCHDCFLNFLQSACTPHRMATEPVQRDAPRHPGAARCNGRKPDGLPVTGRMASGPVEANGSDPLEGERSPR